MSTNVPGIGLEMCEILRILRNKKIFLWMVKANNSHVCKELSRLNQMQRTCAVYDRFTQVSKEKLADRVSILSWIAALCWNLEGFHIFFFKFEMKETCFINFLFFKITQAILLFQRLVLRKRGLGLGLGLELGLGFGLGLGITSLML